jgi:hypothetical protein
MGPSARETDAAIPAAQAPMKGARASDSTAEDLPYYLAAVAALIVTTIWLGLWAFNDALPAAGARDFYRAIVKCCG